MSIQIKNLSKKFNNIYAVNNLSFDIESMNYSNSSLHDDYDSFLYENDSIIR